MDPKQQKEERVFVYGTLRRDGSNAWRMKGATWIAAATTRGHLYRVDWYPGAVFDQTTESIILGELYAVPAEPLQELDAFEGAEYERVKITVTTSADTIIEAWAWQYLPPTTHLKKILSGDWLSL